MLNLDHPINRQFPEPLKEAAWILGTHEEIAFVAIDADDIVQLQQQSGKYAILITYDADRQWVIVEQVANLRQRADRGNSPGRHDRDVIGKLFQLLQFMARNEQTLAAAGQFPE